MKTNKYILILTFLVTGMVASAQQGERSEILEQLRIARLSESLGLSVEEGQQFWPIYNSYRSDLDELNSSKRRVFKQLYENRDNVDEAMMLEAIARRKAIVIDQENRTERFMSEVMALLGPRRTLEMVKAEEEFRRDVMRELQNRKGRRQR